MNFTIDMRRLLVVLVFCWALPLLAQQTDTAQVSGVVMDSSHGVIPNAKVQVTQTATGLTRTVQTGPQGSYTIPALSVGPYQIGRAHV